MALFYINVCFVFLLNLKFRTFSYYKNICESNVPFYILTSRIINIFPPKCKQVILDPLVCVYVFCTCVCVCVQHKNFISKGAEAVKSQELVSAASNYLWNVWKTDGHRKRRLHRTSCCPFGSLPSSHLPNAITRCETKDMRYDQCIFLKIV